MPETLTTVDIKNKISQSIKSFNNKSLYDSSKALLNSLGYTSNKTLRLSPNNFAGFSKIFDFTKNNFNSNKAIVEEWKEVEIIFQISSEDLTDQNNLFNISKVDDKIIESYLFIAVELKKESYSRTALAQITREINKLTSMPSMLIFHYNNFVTLSLIDRRLHKRDESKDVLRKVTLIKDIQIPSPLQEPVPNYREEGKGEVKEIHRAHIEILYDLSLDRIKQQHKVSSFIELHEAWRKILDTKELNKKFFRELAIWYFWAIDKTVWPDDDEQLGKKDVRNATNVIRLITRLIFIWFLKEKNLVNEKLFNERELKSILNYNDLNKSTYYKAVLQNLFFATLNTPLDKRTFRTKKNFKGYLNKDRGNPFVFRYEDYFKTDFAQLYEGIPFLNGGLFDCLDYKNDKDKMIHIDGFSEEKNNPLKVPDKLFFTESENIDLSEIYNDKRKKDIEVRGLINILNSYKFTIAENTPIEEEIALDPELLGRVFENLLAYYNPETQTTARKQTGSFYTPREIVNYMVDESLIAYLKTKMLEESFGFIKIGSEQMDAFGNKARKGQLKIEEEVSPNRWIGKEEELEKELRNLISYTEADSKFNAEEKKALINAIDNIKVLDPACGSGAFPMGILHKLVHILHKLDPNNQMWKQKQLEFASQIQEPSARQSSLKHIEEVFDPSNNFADYGQKTFSYPQLYLRC